MRKLVLRPVRAFGERELESDSAGPRIGRMSESQVPLFFLVQNRMREQRERFTLDARSR